MARAICGQELLGHLLVDTLGAIQLDRPLSDYLDMTPAELVLEASREASSALCIDGGFQKYVVWSQVLGFLKKNTSLDMGTTSQGRQQAAMASFNLSELRCRISNKRLRYYRHRQSRHRLCSILEQAALTLQRVLPAVESVYERVLDHATFGPGSTSGSSYSERALYYKVSSHQTATVRSREVLLDYVRRNPRWVSSSACNIEYTEHDVLAFVPKSAKTDRTICKQPSLNLFLQKGVESVLAACAKRVGITLADQTRNGALAYLGSVGEPFATIDLSSASDSISYELVRWLLPPDWFALLDGLRTTKTKVPGGELITLAKFSAMGNAFTFPLESLIFWSILTAVRDLNNDDAPWRVYGDDIICSQRVALQLIEALKFAGFRTNVEKSYFFGSFRESCGFDFLGGAKATPIYVRATPQSVTEVYNLHNRLLNHEWLRFPSTLRFLRGCVLDAHTGPWSQPRRELGYWRVDFNPQLDAYFIGDPPSEKEWNVDCQRFEYATSILSRGYARFKFASSSVALHLVLLGVAVDCKKAQEEIYYIQDIANPKLRQKRVSFAYWPTLREVFQDKMERHARGSVTAGACFDVVASNRSVVTRVNTLLGLPQEG